MKQILCLICMGWLAITAKAQAPSLAIATDKTVSLVFPFPILYVDRGTADILVLPIRGASGVLLVKAAAKDFPETNLSVITMDGSIYSFRVIYSSHPAPWVHYLPANLKATMATYANGILDNPVTMSGIKSKNWEMETRITGIYIKDNVIYYQLQLNNHSPVDYDIDLLRFYIRDKRKGRRTAVQENEMHPLYIAGNTTQVKANSRSTIVVALEKFTIPDAKYLAVQIMERNGGRHLSMKVHNCKIIKAIPLPDLK